MKKTLIVGLITFSLNSTLKAYFQGLLNDAEQQKIITNTTEWLSENITKDLSLARVIQQLAYLQAQVEGQNRLLNILLNTLGVTKQELLELVKKEIEKEKKQKEYCPADIADKENQQPIIKQAAQRM